MNRYERDDKALMTEQEKFEAWFKDRYRGILDETNFKLVWVTALEAWLARSKEES